MESLEQGGINQIDQQTGGPEPIRVRCPECLKKYAIDSREISEKKPKFKCTGCESMFWISYPECLDAGEVVGFPVEWLNEPDEDAAHQEARAEAPEVRSFECPKCLQSNPVGASECKKCGVVFEKHQSDETKLATPVASQDLKNIWERVIEDYDKADIHAEFLRACHKENNLEYAAAKYKSILDAHGSDEMALNMRDQIIALTSAEAMTKTPEPKVKRRRRINFTTVIMVLSVACMAVGYFVPMLRNLVGVGAAVLFLALAIKFYFFK